MSSRLFQGMIHQMRESIDRVTGVVDENGVIIACSELVKIGEMRQGVRDELAYTSDVRPHTICSPTPWAARWRHCCWRVSIPLPGRCSPPP